jgi:hypothetical protein
MFGASDLQGTDAVREVDRLTARQPDCYPDMDAGKLMLLRDGLRVDTFSDFDLDALRQGRAGYVRQRALYEWTAECDAYWDDDAVDAYIARAEREVGRWDTEFASSRAAGLATLTKRQPTFADLEDAIRSGAVVPTTIENENAGSSHAVLVFGVLDDGAFEVYCPGDGDSLVPFDGDYLRRVWLAQSLTVVSGGRR